MLIGLFASPLYAQTTTSTAPDAVSVSIYRAPERSADQPMQLQNLEGYALITETRRVSISEGDGVIRFEGVAAGILPESAIVTGLPEGVVEKNQDANLLSPASLLGASTGRKVSLRRTSRATGKTTEEEAVIRSGPGGQVVLQTAAGIEALRCTGIPETIVYDTLPADLSAKPTLSVRTHSGHATTATVTLSYLADNFDWQANYVATIGADGAHLDLFGWVTLASADETSFQRAQAMVIAGRINRDEDRAPTPEPGSSIALTCWPQGTTSDIDPRGPYPPPPPPPAVVAMMEDVVVTARRVEKSFFSAPAMVVQQEELGDLKLYRVPERVTVAAHAQKQIALLEKKSVPVKLIWRTTISDGEASAVVLTLRARNRADGGLGLPLPSGKVAVFRASGARPLLIGEGWVADRAIGEDVEIGFADSPSVIAKLAKSEAEHAVLTVTNANPYPVPFEAKFEDNDLDGFSGKVRRKDGAWLWEASIPANGTVTLAYNVKN